MAGQKEARRLLFQIIHQLLEFAEAYFVLRNGFWKYEMMPKGGLTLHAKNGPQVFHRHFGCGIEQRQLWCAGATQIAGQCHVSGGRAVRKE